MMPTFELTWAQHASCIARNFAQFCRTCSPQYETTMAAVDGTGFVIASVIVTLQSVCECTNQLCHKPLVFTIHSLLPERCDLGVSREPALLHYLFGQDPAQLTTWALDISVLPVTLNS